MYVLLEKVALTNFPVWPKWLVIFNHAVKDSPDLNKATEGEEDFAFSDSNGLTQSAVAIAALEQPLIQPRPIRILSIGILRNKPVVAYNNTFSTGPMKVITYENFVMKRESNLKPIHRNSKIMGRAELLDEVPVLAFQSEPSQAKINRDMQSKRSAS